MARQPKKEYLIFVEGDSEELYFSAMKQQQFLRDSKYRLDIINCGGINKLLDISLKQKHYKKKLREAEKIAFIVDKDHMTIDQYTKLINKQYIIGFTNPQVELWFLAHFEKIQSTTINIIPKLKNHIPNYYKTHPGIADLAPNWETAEKNLENHSTLQYTEVCSNLASVIRSFF